MKLLIQNATICNEGEQYTGSVLVENGIIKHIYKAPEVCNENTEKVIDATGKLLIPGMIDDQVHFRQPGLTHKGDIASESRAAVAGGVTSFMDMPNVKPASTTLELLEERYDIAKQQSFANYSFYLGGTNDNLAEIKKINPKQICGVKLFMGSSTGNMLVDNPTTLERVFAESPVLIATHCEDEATIKHNTEVYKAKYGDNIPFSCHPLIRSAEACYKSSSFAVGLAQKYGTRLHVLHITTAKELELFDPNSDKITAEVCVHHLWFSDEDYATKGSLIKCNPAVKTKNDRDALLDGLKKGKIRVIASDHAPHTWDEKQQDYLNAPSGLPLVQHSVPLLFDLARQGKIDINTIVEKTSHAPALLFNIEKRGFIRKGYYADLVLLDPNTPQVVEKSNIYYKCGWSPFEGQTLHTTVTHTLVNGVLVYENGVFGTAGNGMRLTFNR